MAILSFKKHHKYVKFLKISKAIWNLPNIIKSFKKSLKGYNNLIKPFHKVSQILKTFKFQKASRML